MNLPHSDDPVTSADPQPRPRRPAAALRLARLEPALWRWALLAALLTAAFWITRAVYASARAGRYSLVDCSWTGDWDPPDPPRCTVLDRWTGDLVDRPVQEYDDGSTIAPAPGTARHRAGGVAGT